MGRPAQDSRLFINAVFWILRTGSLWRDLPPDYGGWKNTHRRFCRCRDKGVWAFLLERLIDEPDYEWLMIDASHCKVHPHAVDAHGMTVRIIATEGTRADCSEATRLIEGIDAEHLIADQGYDSDAVIQQARSQGMPAQIPPRKNRKEARDYDKHLYRQRHQVENAFLHLKGWRRIATRYAKNLASFLAAAQIRCPALWPRIS